MLIVGHLERGRTPCLVLRNRGKSAHLTIDTGFDGDLCLNREILKVWGFEFKGTEEVELADGSIITSKFFVGTIRWMGRVRKVLAHETMSKESLLGTGLLEGVVLKLDISKGYVLLRKGR